VGSGLALQLLASSRADVAITHAPQREAAALQSHPNWWYRKILYNEFVLVGPPEDPARVGDAADVTTAMRRIAASGVIFISRGDESGTHDLERQLWAVAGVVPGKGRLVVAGAGMGQTIRIASSTNAYTLTDSGTFAALQSSIRLQVLFRGDPRLVNTYAVIIDPANERARRFGEWLVNGDGRTNLERIVSTEVRGFAVWPMGIPGDRPDSRPR
jgi:tungstate transport system substrate-binding protein